MSKKDLILYFKKKDLESLGKIRTMPHLTIALEGDFFYAKGFAVSKKTIPILAALPAQVVYELDANNLLFPKGKTTPIKTLPNLTWQPIRQVLPIEMPVAALSGQPPRQDLPTLVRADNSQKGTVLKTTISLWKQYAETAAAVRLAQLKFAVSEKGEVLIWGTPLPPIPGQEFWVSNGNFLPCGFDFELSLYSILIQKQWNALQDAILLFDKTGNWEKIALKNFVKGTRSAVRMTEG